MHVLSNSGWFDGCEQDGKPVTAHPLRGDSPAAVARQLWASRHHAAVVFDVAPRELMLACALKKVTPDWSSRLVSVDLILRRPTTARQRLQLSLTKWLLKEVDLFILYFKDTQALRELYGIEAERVRYVPFKVNNRERVLETKTSDEGFFLTCGRSNRDFETFIRAFDGLPYHAKILAPFGAEAAEHGTWFDPARCPSNVEAVEDDGSATSWIDWIARSRCVVLPVVPGMLSPSGIGTYLVAMALGKPVIMTEGPATRGILEDGMALLIPPADTKALRDAVTKVAEDEAVRRGLIEAGKAYALSLGDEDRLARDIRREVFRLVDQPTMRTAR
jgi:glycosyltransferase involved in cell wall biosynthesis